MIAPRLLGGLLGLIALASTAWLVKDRFAQKAVADDARACATAAASQGDRLDRCLPGLRAAIEQQRGLKACDGALLPQLNPARRFAAASYCGPGVKRLIAAHDAAAIERDEARRLLAQQRAETVAAVARAEARATRSTERTTDGRRTIDAAPRRADGRIVCDAACLRSLNR